RAVGFGDRLGRHALKALQRRGPQVDELRGQRRLRLDRPRGIGHVIFGDMADRADHFADFVGDRRLDLAGLARPQIGGDRAAGVLDRVPDVARERLGVREWIRDAEAEGAARRRFGRGRGRGGRGFRRGRRFGGRRGRGLGLGHRGSGFVDLRRGRRRGRGRDIPRGRGSDVGGGWRGRLLAPGCFGRGLGGGRGRRSFARRGGGRGLVGRRFRRLRLFRPRNSPRSDRGGLGRSLGRRRRQGVDPLVERLGLRPARRTARLFRRRRQRADPFRLRRDLRPFRRGRRRGLRGSALRLRAPRL